MSIDVEVSLYQKGEIFHCDGAKVFNKSNRQSPLSFSDVQLSSDFTGETIKSSSDAWGVMRIFLFCFFQGLDFTSTINTFAEELHARVGQSLYL